MDQKYRVESAKVLDVSLFIDEHLTRNVHINNIGKNIAKNVGIISKIPYLLSSHILINLYYLLIYPYLAYCNLCWTSTYPTRLETEEVAKESNKNN